MKKWILMGVLAMAASTAPQGILPEGAVEITENRVDSFVAPSGAKYDMRTYRVSPTTPFYITVQPAGRSLTFGSDGRSAGAAATKYIQTRGCTRNLSRLTSRDIYDAASKTWTIAIDC